MYFLCTAVQTHNDCAMYSTVHIQTNSVCLKRLNIYIPSHLNRYQNVLSIDILITLNLHYAFVSDSEKSPSDTSDAQNNDSLYRNILKICFPQQHYYVSALVVRHTVWYILLWSMSYSLTSPYQTGSMVMSMSPSHLP